MRRYAELLADNRGFSAEEDEYFTNQAQYAYESFRDKAALSRGMAVDKMQEVAQVCVGSAVHACDRCQSVCICSYAFLTTRCMLSVGALGSQGRQRELLTPVACSR